VCLRFLRENPWERLRQLKAVCRKTPLQVHSHMTSGMAVAMYLSAVKAGAGAIDTAVSTLSGFSSQPLTETLVAILESEGYDTGLNHAMVAKANGHFKALKKVREPSSGLGESVDADVLEHHIPGGMISNLAKQLLNGEKPVTCRPADLLKPGLADAAAQFDPKLIEKEEDILSYCLFPEVALGYFKWRAKPAAQREPIPADLEGAGVQKVQEAGGLKPEAGCQQAAVSDETQRFAEIGRLAVGLASRLGFGSGALPAVLPDLPAAAPAPVQKAETPAVTGPTINAPLSGTFYRSPGPGKPELAKEGDSLKAGEPLCIVEAMKLFNHIKADKSLRVLNFLVMHGAVVAKGQPLAVVQY
jgi:pyruvate carboxylase